MQQLLMHEDNGADPEIGMHLIDLQVFIIHEMEQNEIFKFSLMNHALKILILHFYT